MTDDPCIPVSEIIAASQVRELCGGARTAPGPDKTRPKRAPITRHTLAAWQETRGFPAPFKTLPGPGGKGEIGLWDRRAVKEWLREQRRLKRQG